MNSKHGRYSSSSVCFKDKIVWMREGVSFIEGCVTPITKGEFDDFAGNDPCMLG